MAMQGMSYVFVMLFGLWGAYCVLSTIRWLVLGFPPLGALALAVLAALCLLFLAARRLFRLGSMSASIIHFRRVACWLSLITPFAALALCHYRREWPWGMPVTKIYWAWHLGFSVSGALGPLALVPVLARREYRWVWLPILGLGLTISFAASTEHLMHIH